MASAMDWLERSSKFSIAIPETSIRERTLGMVLFETLLFSSVPALGWCFSRMDYQRCLVAIFQTHFERFPLAGLRARRRWPGRRQ